LERINRKMDGTNFENGGSQQQFLFAKTDGGKEEPNQ
jgi:hypothetical protein